MRLSLLAFLCVMLQLVSSIVGADEYTGGGNGDRDRLRVFLSDLHIGVGRTEPLDRIEDFFWEDEFAQFTKFISEQGKGKVDLIFLGDVFELWQSHKMQCSGDEPNARCTTLDCEPNSDDLGCSEGEALARLKHILSQHERFFQTLREFVSGTDNRIVIVPGNHDAALLFDQVGKAVLDAVGSDRLTVASEGYWISTDGTILADHGHEFDKVNAFSGWPRPFRRQADKLHLERPWGENMVQKFYNQYEFTFPIIDNISEEAAGIRLAIKSEGGAMAVQATGQFIKFLVLQNSLRQFVTFLGNNNAQIDPSKSIEWDHAWVREKGQEFLLDSLAADKVLLGLAREALKQGDIAIKPADLSDEEITLLCDGREIVAKEIAEQDLSAKIERCRRKGEAHLGWIADQVLDREATNRREHLLRVREEIKKRSGKPRISIYVYGHTHKAEKFDVVVVDDYWRLGIYNTGAFQRIITPKQLDRLTSSRKFKENPKELLRKLRPTNLPPCYTYVRIDPYTQNPSAQIKRWVRDANGGWKEETWESYSDCSADFQLEGMAHDK